MYTSIYKPITACTRSFLAQTFHPADMDGRRPARVFDNLSIEAEDAIIEKMFKENPCLYDIADNGYIFY